MLKSPLKTLAIIIVLLVLALCSCSSIDDEDGNQAAKGSKVLEDEKIPPIYREAMQKFKQHGLLFDENQPFNVKTLSDFNTYLGKQDPYAEYLQAEAYNGFKNSQGSQYAGVGMEIEKTETGGVACFPFIGSPAWESGIKNGDILLSINGAEISGLSVYTVATELMGKAGSTVALATRDKNGDRRSFTIIRSIIHTRSVIVDYGDVIPIVKITNFDNSTKSELKYELSQCPDTHALVLDLRGNPGGDLYKCIDAAMLFLPTDAPIVTVETREGRQTYRSSTPEFDSAFEIYIWQNENTASAAEVFIAALTQNMRALSIGRKSHGKGTTQEIFELSDGAAIFFTIGYLRTPNDDRYHQLGLEPTYILNDNQLTTNDYLQETRNLLASDQPRNSDIN